MLVTGTQGTLGDTGSLPFDACNAGASSTRAKLGADPVMTLIWPPRTCVATHKAAHC